MTDPTRLTDGSLTPGVYRLLGQPDVIDSALARAGWRSVVVPPSSRISEFYAVLSTALQLPDYFGRNLDALWDCLNDLDAPTALILSDWTRLARARPDTWTKIMNVLAERCAITPAFAVVLA
jgi:RNAse (barnase) inhibitor barstar